MSSARHATPARLPRWGPRHATPARLPRWGPRHAPPARLPRWGPRHATPARLPRWGPRHATPARLPRWGPRHGRRRCLSYVVSGFSRTVSAMLYEREGFAVEIVSRYSVSPAPRHVSNRRAPDRERSRRTQLVR